MTEFYFVEFTCECGQENVVISPGERAVVECNCGRFQDVWVDKFLMEGTEEDVIRWINEQ